MIRSTSISQLLLLRTFRVKISKSKSNEKKHQIEFKDIIGNVSHNLSKEIISNISTPTCFVCLLHLSNEKSTNIILLNLGSFITLFRSNKY